MSNHKLKDAISLKLKQDDALFIRQALNLVVNTDGASKDAKNKAWKLMVRITDGLMKLP